MTHVHLIGIGGYGLSAIARLLHEKGYRVSGSDRQLSELAESLQAAGITIYQGHAANQIEGADLVVRSSAIPDNNPEVQAALSAGIPVLKRADFLGELMKDEIGIAVAGTHGKTTTTAMIAWMLAALQEDPSYIIGGVSKNLGQNAHAGEGKFFVIEADEYDRMFHGLQPTIGVVTNMEHDHPDCFPSPQDYLEAFAIFAGKVKTGGWLLACGDDPGVQQLLKTDIAVPVFTYGTDVTNRYQANMIRKNTLGGYSFTAMHAGEVVVEVHLHVPGLHNVLNALAAIAIAHQYQLDLAKAAEALSAFNGTGRRFDLCGEALGITIIDDYAHHPTEIRATLEAACNRFGDRQLWIVWQPHTYSRTKTLFKEFSESFQDADRVIVTEVFASREVSDGFSAAEVVAAMPHPQAEFIAEIPDVSAYLLENLQRDDVLIVLSAGDANQISRDVLSGLIEKETAQ